MFISFQVNEGHLWEDMKSSASNLATKVTELVFLHELAFVNSICSQEIVMQKDC